MRDVADLHLKAMTDPAARGERFIATAGDFASIRQIAQMLKDGAGEPPARFELAPCPTGSCARSGCSTPRSEAILPELGKRKNASNEKARRLLGWAPRSPEEAVWLPPAACRSSGF